MPSQENEVRALALAVFATNGKFDQRRKRTRGASGSNQRLVAGARGIALFTSPASSRIDRPEHGPDPQAVQRVVDVLADKD